MAKSGNIETYDHHRGRAPLLRPTSRWRTWLFLSVNLLGFVAVNAFWRYVATGRWVDLTAEAYRRELVSPLGKMLTYPLSVLEQPWMILVIGLLLALVILVPVIVAVLYRLVYAAMFVVVLAVVGQAPLLGLAVAVGCVLAGRTPLRSDMPFLAAIGGMVPVAGYLYFFGLGETGSSGMLPLQRLVLNAPLLVAIVSAALAAAVVLALAHVTAFRPGIVWPVMVCLLAGPIVVFYTRIGPAELDYALIAKGLAPGDVLFPSQTLDEWIRRNRAQGLCPAACRERLQGDLETNRSDLVAKCMAFLESHPRSSRAPAALWVAGQCMSLQVDEPSLQLQPITERDRGRGTVRYSASYVLPTSAQTWTRLRRDYGSAPQAALADWKLGELALRAGRTGEADERLHAARDRLREYLASRVKRDDPERQAGPFAPLASAPSRRYYADALFAVERLVWLMEQNDVLNDSESSAALADYLNLNPFRTGYEDRLAELLSDPNKGYEKTKMGDNLKLAYAQVTTDPYARAEMLILLAEDERTDAAIEANYELGKLAMQPARAPAVRLLVKGPEEYFKLVVAAPANPWQRLAAEELRSLRSVSVAQTRPSP